MNVRETLKGVPWLSGLSESELHEVAAQSEGAAFRAGETIVAELESGDGVFVLFEGAARATVQAGPGEPREVGTLKPGDACGQISLLTRQLHLATVTATTDVVALKFDRATFGRLTSRHPSILTHFARSIADLIVKTDSALDALLEAKADPIVESLAGRSAAVVHSRGSLARAWKELVISRGHQLPFLALLTFIVTLVAARGATFMMETYHISLFPFLRAAYMTGIGLLFVSTATSLLRFRRSIQQVLAVVFGAGFALILNELSVFLAFDTFYIDMTTPDPNMVFNVETLYRRSETTWAILLMAAFLAQAAFLGRFYRRCFFIARTRLASLFGGRR